MVNRIRKRRRRHHGSRNGQFPWDARDRGRRRAGDRNRRWNRIVYGISAAILFVVVSTCIVWQIRPDHVVEEPREFPTWSNAANTSDPPATLQTRSEAAISELLGFVNDPTHASRSKRMHGQADALEHLEDYYDRRGNNLPRKIINPSVSSVNFKDRELLLVAFLDENGRSWAAPFEWNGSSYRMHWEAMVGYGEVSWVDFFDKRPKGRYKVRANFFLPDHEVFDPVAKDCILILMSHPELSRPATVLVQNGSAIHRQLANCPRATDIPGIVEIQWQQGESNQPELTGQFQRDWIN
jgi:hypothetical protein